MPSVDRGSTKWASCLAAQPLIAQQAAISNKYFRLLGKKIAPLLVWQRLRPRAGHGWPGLPRSTHTNCTRTAAPAWLQRAQSTLRGVSHLNAATWLQQQCPKRALGSRRRALSPGDVLWIMETRHLDGQQTCRRKEKGWTPQLRSLTDTTGLPCSAGLLASIRLPDCTRVQYSPPLQGGH